MFDRPFCAEVVELISELGSAVAVDNDRRAVRTDEQRDEVRDLFCRRVFSTLADVRETGKLICKNQELLSFVAREIHVQGVEWIVCFLVGAFRLRCLAR